MPTARKLVWSQPSEAEQRIHTAHRAAPSTARATYQTRLTTYPHLMSLTHTPSRPYGAEEQPVLLI
jgi:hypothetical protein